jgi:hypothetical protein
MSVWLKKRTAGSAPGVEWTKDGDVQEVQDEDMARELLDRGDGEFTEAKRPAGARPSDEAKAERVGREVSETGTGNAAKADVGPAATPLKATSGAVIPGDTTTNPTSTKAGK